MIADNQLKNIYNQGWDNCSNGKESRESEFKSDIERFAYLLGYNDYQFNMINPNVDDDVWKEKLERIRTLGEI